jgi:hypothetical protein
MGENYTLKEDRRSSFTGVNPPSIDDVRVSTFHPDPSYLERPRPGQAWCRGRTIKYRTHPDRKFIMGRYAM